ncbi:MAG TPA: TolC family protein [Kofleriaceae bacterium]|nr:TolC family protein [Kofleriaceae bacterium]
MTRVLTARWIAAALVLHSLPAFSEPIELDLRGALDRAHRVAPEAIAARGRVAEARALVIGAGLPFTSNPEVEIGAGPRLTTDRPIDADARIEQSLEPGRRGARRGLARAEVDRAQALAAAAVRELDLEVSAAFVEALFAERGAELARHGEDLAQRAVDVAERRRKAGDITDLDANLARAALGRARSAVQAAAAQRAGAAGRLAELIGAQAGDTIAVRGDLRALAAPALDAVPPAGAARADVRALTAERELAIAERAQAVASGRPEVALWGSYRREDTADIVLGGLRMTLPVWNRAQGETAAARAREQRAMEARDAALRAADRQLADARAVYQGALRSVEIFERDVAPLLEDSEQLLQRTVDAGQITVSDYLVARQELLNGRREYLDRLLALARAAVALRYAAGVSS